MLMYPQVRAMTQHAHAHAHKQHTRMRQRQGQLLALLTPNTQHRCSRTPPAPSPVQQGASQVRCSRCGHLTQVPQSQGQRQGCTASGCFHGSTAKQLGCQLVPITSSCVLGCFHAVYCSCASRAHLKPSPASKTMKHPLFPAPSFLTLQVTTRISRRSSATAAGCCCRTHAVHKACSAPFAT